MYYDWDFNARWGEDTFGIVPRPFAVEKGVEIKKNRFKPGL